MRGNLNYADDNCVVYPAGHQTVVYNTETKLQKFVAGTSDSEGISGICVSPNNKFLAVAEQSEKAMITVYDLQTLKRRKVLMSTDAGSKVRDVAISAAVIPRIVCGTCRATP